MILTKSTFVGVLYGGLHQAGVVPSLLYLQKQKALGRFHSGTEIIYHRTYMPPKHLLQVCFIIISVGTFLLLNVRTAAKSGAEVSLLSL